MKATNLHGGDLDEISRIYNIDKSEIINFSGNVNPLGLPESVRKAIRENVDLATGYPDVSYIALKQAISEYTGAEVDNIIVGNGSTELISGFIKSVMPKEGIIISPAYSEYFKIMEQIGCKVTLSPLKEEDDFIPNPNNLEISDSTDMVVICNPNNPTGTYLTSEQIESLAKKCLKHNCYIMIDETYVEFSDPQKNISSVDVANRYKNVFIIRGTSKFFACPGLRLGYGITCNNDVIAKINTIKDLWSVNVFAELAGCVMFKDKSFIDKTINLITSERKRILQSFAEIKKVKVYNTQSNFFLVKILDKSISSQQVFMEMIKDKMLIRNAEDFPYLDDEFLRFCILLPYENDLLIKKFKETLI